jgi:hypothetical protein
MMIASNIAIAIMINLLALFQLQLLSLSSFAICARIAPLAPLHKSLIRAPCNKPTRPCMQAQRCSLGTAVPLHADPPPGNSFHNL